MRAIVPMNTSAESRSMDENELQNQRTLARKKKKQSRFGALFSKLGAQKRKEDEVEHIIKQQGENLAKLEHQAQVERQQSKSKLNERLERRRQKAAKRKTVLQR